MSQLKALVRASFPGVPQMSIEELDRRLGEDPQPLVIDVREPFEYEVSHLPGAVHAQGNLQQPQTPTSQSSSTAPSATAPPPPSPT
ncbi:MAG: rhodanese-like domain-containing protein [Acidobacteria bacterium]|nr:rhodanese-like domain-containing protein [Acidobacteriota bacterium]